MGKSKKHERAAENETLIDARAEGETWAQYGKRMARETPMRFEPAPADPHEC